MNITNYMIEKNIDFFFIIEQTKTNYNILV